MRCDFRAKWLPLLEDRCAVLEALAEGWALAYQAEMANEDGERDESFPCCVKCAEACFCPLPGAAGHVEPITEGQRKVMKSEGAVGDLNRVGGPKAVPVRSASDFVATKRGNVFEAACYQCACERFRGKDCYVAVDYDDAGNVHAYVRYPDGEMKDPQEMMVSTDACACGGPE